MDSSANEHKFGSKELMQNYSQKSCNQGIGTADGNTTKVHGEGKASIALSCNVELEKSTVLHAPNLEHNPISVSAITENGIRVIFEDEFCFMEKDGIVLDIIEKDPVSRIYIIP